MQRTRDRYTITTDRSALDIDFIHHYLSVESYWAAGRAREVVVRSVEQSLCFGLYDTQANRQIGFARVVTDCATFAWLCDVFVDEAYRGAGLGKWLIETVTEHPDLANIRRLILATRDAHGLYAQYGFEPMDKPERWMLRMR